MSTRQRFFSDHFLELACFFIFLFLLTFLFSERILYAEEKKEDILFQESITNYSFQEASSRFETLSQVWFFNKIYGLSNDHFWNFMQENWEKPVYMRSITSFSAGFFGGSFRKHEGMVIKVFKDEASLIEFIDLKKKSRPPYFGNGEIGLIEAIFDFSKKVYTVSEVYALDDKGQIKNLEKNQLFLGGELWQR